MAMVVVPVSVASSAVFAVALLANFAASVTASPPSPGLVYVVHLRGNPVVSHFNIDHLSKPPKSSMQAYAAYLESFHDSVLKDSLQEDEYHKLYSYKTILNAFSVKLSNYLQVGYLKAHPAVLMVEEERVFEKLTTHTPDFLNLDSGAWKVSGGAENAGEGIVIGVLDTGIDPTHPSFSATHDKSKPYLPLPGWQGKCEVSDTFPDGSCNQKIIAAHHFTRGIIAANVFNASYDFDSPLDGDGHGTHTSSIAAGNHGIPVVVDGYTYGYASGAAPRARLAAYKVIYRDGGYLTDVLAGIDKAVEDGVDILSISIGSTNGDSVIPFLNSFDISLLYAVKAGVVVVHAAGNNGPAPISMNSFGPWSISVASGSTDRLYRGTLVLGNKQVLSGIGLSDQTPGEHLYPLIFSRDAFADHKSASFDADYYSSCPDPTPFNKTLVKGKFMICNSAEFITGGVGAQIQAAVNTANQLGAVGLIVITQASTDDDLDQSKSGVMDPLPFSIPGTFLTSTDDSMGLLDYYNLLTSKDNFGKEKEFLATARITDSRKANLTSVAPRVMSYSSRGPVYADRATSVISDLLKPDILAPGNQIWGAWTGSGIDISSYKGKNFAMVSGTSMAAPQIAGIAALLKQKQPRWSNAGIRSALLTTAMLYDNTHQPIQAQQPQYNISTALGWASPFDCGSGNVNATASLDPGLIFDVGFQDYINFLCTLPGSDVNSVQELTGASCRTRVGDRSSDLNLPSVTVANLVGARVVRRRVLFVGKEEEEFKAKVHPPAGVQVRVSPRTLTLREGEFASFTITLKAMQSNQGFTFGRLIWMGNKGHIVRIPLSVSANLVTHD